MREDLVKKLIIEKIGVDVRDITTLVGGQVGHVYRVDTLHNSYVVKLVDVWPELSFFEESRNARVYGSRWNNLLPAYALLEKSDIPIPKLYTSGSLKSENIHYEILEYLSGNPDDYSVGWFAAVGKALGTIHKISRPYQGWVDIERPYTECWSDAFTQSLESQLGQARLCLPTELHAQITKHISKSEQITEPGVFVLSHTDGFQGVLRKEGAKWDLVGVIDIEDHQFTDQRFVLSGFELSHTLEKRTTPNEFWTMYSEQIPIDPTFDTYKKLFQIYYLLVWSRVLKDQPGPFKKCVDKLSELVT